MSGVETISEDTAEVHAPVPEDTTTESHPDVPKSQSVDHGEELKTLQSRLDKAEKTIVKYKRQSKEAKGAEGDDSEDLVTKVVAALREERSTWQEQEQQDYVSSTIDEVSSSAEEAKLIQFHLEHTLNISDRSKEGMRDAVQRAKLLANEKLYKEKVKELSDALVSKNTRSGATMSGESTKTKKKQLSSEEKKMRLLLGLK